MVLTSLIVAASATSPRAVPSADAPSRGEAAGRLEGSVLVGPQLSARKIRFSLYPDLAQPAIASEPQIPGHEVGNVIISFEPAPALDGTAPPQTARPVMRQEGLTFVPHILAIPRGATVEFPNGDAIFHNVFSLSKAASFDLGRYPKGSSKSVRFDRPGIVKVFCHIHSDMSGVIVILDNPYFAIPDARGHYSIDGVPPGEYRVKAWHERARPLEKTVRIQAGQASTADFSIPLTEIPGGE
ncbi:MAG TPA: carboxypeptidase regulatory-like domain-containing protein [Candidatus Polarisedimenticolia bacterium]|nr:carboxypeptidase regulatory-like domain-containing protein [Candidatus Polarisedimenticolia bacterium]